MSANFEMADRTQVNDEDQQQQKQTGENTVNTVNTDIQAESHHVLTRNNNVWVLSRYERARIIGTRIEQLQRGGMPMIDIPPDAKITVREIALKEFAERKIPFEIMRRMPDRRKQFRSLSDILY